MRRGSTWTEQQALMASGAEGPFLFQLLLGVHAPVLLLHDDCDKGAVGCDTGEVTVAPDDQHLRDGAFQAAMGLLHDAVPVRGAAIEVDPGLGPRGLGTRGYYRLGISRARNELGYEPKYDPKTAALDWIKWADRLELNHDDTK